VPNVPTPVHQAALTATLTNVIEKVRTHFGKPVKINSGYRSPAVNKKVGGAATSQHCNGEAIDFEIPGVANIDVADWVADNLVFDQIILEFYNPAEGPSSGWVHVSYKAGGGNRKQKLIALKTGGKTIYKNVTDFK
jgi:zinc D-Ala-D-Ala carboxypeptidase